MQQLSSMARSLFNTPTKRYELLRRRRFFWRKFTGSLLVRLWSLESIFLVLAILPSFSDRPHDVHCASPKRKYVSNQDLDGTGVTRSFAASPLISSW